MAVIAPKPVWGSLGYTDPRTGALTAGGQQALAQWHQAILSIPISVSGEQVKGAGTQWMLANTPSGNVNLLGETAGGLVPLKPGKGKPWNYVIEGGQIVTEQEFVGVTASYEYSQS